MGEGGDGVWVKSLEKFLHESNTSQARQDEAKHG